MSANRHSGARSSVLTNAAGCFLLALALMLISGFFCRGYADDRFTLYGIDKFGDIVGPITTADQYCQVAFPHPAFEPQAYSAGWIGPNFTLNVHGTYSEATTYCEWTYSVFYQIDENGNEVWIPQPNVKWPFLKLQVNCNHPIGTNPNWPYLYGYSFEYAPISPGFCSHYFLTVPPPAKFQQGACCNAGASQPFLGDPINVANSSVFARVDDVGQHETASTAGFGRFYNSTDLDDGAANGWRYTYSRHVDSQYSTIETRDYVQSPSTSSPYPDAATACTSGFLDIQSQVTNWAGATAAYTGGICQLTKSGVVIGSLTVYTTDDAFPTASTPVAFDVIRDDGQEIRFIVDGSSILAPPGTSFRLQPTANGYSLVDAGDTVESYDATGKLLSIMTHTGVAQTMSYDSGGRLSTVTDNFGHQLTLGYDNQNRVSAVTQQ